MHRISLLLAALSLVPSCTDGAPTSTTEQKATTPYVAESRRCDPSFCILFTAQDSDHDGVSDVDEKAAGTDPNDPLKYPTLVELAKLLAKHELPTFEVGNSMMILLPTRDANGLPIFGGAPALPARKTGIETAGIKVPDGIDLSGGFTMSRTVSSNEIVFGQLVTAFGRQKEGAMPVRMLADAIGFAPNGDWHTRTGSIEGQSTLGTHLTGTWSNDGKSSAWSVASDGLTFAQSVEISTDAEGTITTVTLTRTGNKGTWTNNVTRTDGRSTTKTQTTTTTSDYTYKEPREPRTTVCDYGVCYDEPPEAAEPPPDDDPPPEEPEDHDDDYGYIDPEAVEQSGVITANPDGMATAIATLGATILVVQDHGNPLTSYEVPPTGIHDAYGPIALYGGDPDNAAFGLTPAFVRVPQPEYDPNLTEQKPPMSAPPDGTCTYCFQH